MTFNEEKNSGKNLLDKTAEQLKRVLKKIPKSVWILVALVAAVYTTWSIVYPFGSWRYKTTVVVETPEGIKTGSAVREVFAYRLPGFLGVKSRGYVQVKKGEAVVVDLSERGVLFALMSGATGVDYGAHVVLKVFPFKGGEGPLSPKGIRYYKSLKAGTKAVLTPGQYPIFVRFLDLKEPKTVEAVITFKDVARHWPPQYAIASDRTEEIFGAGVRIKEVTIEMTDDPVTWGIEKRLPWLPAYFNKMFDGQRYNTVKTENPFANSLASGTFKVGEK